MIDKDTFKLSVIIPCYNEKQTIGAILKKVIQSLQNYKFLNYEILIIDDHSKDGTDKILKDFSHKCKGGEPDFTNSTHLNYLRESILKYDEEFRNNTYALNEFIGNLRNGKEIITEDWWSDMTPAQQAQYIKDHPKSQKALDAKDKETEKDSATSKITREDIDITLKAFSEIRTKLDKGFYKAE